MGTDVDYHIEARAGDGPWSLVLNPPELEYIRNSKLFCALGNDILHRGLTYKFEQGQLDPYSWREPPPAPLMPPRGWPDDIDKATERAANFGGEDDEHTKPEAFAPTGPWRCTWYTLAELEELAPRLPPGEVTSVLMPFMRGLGLPPENVRLLVGFV